MEIKSEVRKYVIENLMNDGPAISLSDTTPLITGGLIDSIGMISLVRFMKAASELCSRRARSTRSAWTPWTRSRAWFPKTGSSASRTLTIGSRAHMSRLIPWRSFPLAFAFLSLFGCRRMHKQAFEKAPLVRGQVEVVRVSETAGLAVDRIRFWSNKMAEPRFFLALVPKTSSHIDEAFILNHGWWDRPEDLLKHLKVDEVYSGMLARGEVRPAIIVIPDVRFSNFYRVNTKRFPFPNYLTLVPVEVAGVVSQHYGIPMERERWAFGGFSFGGYLISGRGKALSGPVRECQRSQRIRRFELDFLACRSPNQ